MVDRQHLSAANFQVPWDISQTPTSPSPSQTQKNKQTNEQQTFHTGKCIFFRESEHTRQYL